MAVLALLFVYLCVKLVRQVTTDKRKPARWENRRMYQSRPSLSSSLVGIFTSAWEPIRVCNPVSEHAKSSCWFSNWMAFSNSCSLSFGLLLWRKKVTTRAHLQPLRGMFCISSWPSSSSQHHSLHAMHSWLRNRDPWCFSWWYIFWLWSILLLFCSKVRPRGYFGFWLVCSSNLQLFAWLLNASLFIVHI